MTIHTAVIPGLIRDPGIACVPRSTRVRPAMTIQTAVIPGLTHYCPVKVDPRSPYSLEKRLAGAEGDLNRVRG
jgi:hypothetical protein